MLVNETNAGTSWRHFIFPTSVEFRVCEKVFVSKPAGDEQATNMDSSGHNSQHTQRLVSPAF